MTGHTAELRLYKELGDFEIRLAYRAHVQSAASFWCNEDPTSMGMRGCYVESRFRYNSLDPKFGPLSTQLPELKVVWELRVFENVPVLKFFAPGAWEVSYGYYFQSAYYGGRGRDFRDYRFLFPHDGRGAHLLQTGYSLPF